MGMFFLFVFWAFPLFNPAMWLETLNNVYTSLSSMTEERLPSVLLLLVKASSDYACKSYLYYSGAGDAPPTDKFTEFLNHIAIPVLSFVAQILSTCSGSPVKPEDEAMDLFENSSADDTIRVDEEQARMIWKLAVSMADYDISQVSVDGPDLS
jgi:hypothetical protein